MDRTSQERADQPQFLSWPHIIDSSEAFNATPQRRSANYKPNIWKFDFLQSLTSIYDGEEYRRRAEKLREDVKGMLVEAVDENAKLEFIDRIAKLGLSNLFAEEIQKALQTIASSKKSWKPRVEENLYITTLRFRLLRQHGFEVSQDVFTSFLDEKGVFPRSKCSDINGLLELFEASYLALEGENILDEAKAFSKEALKSLSFAADSNNLLTMQVVHALELSSHWRVKWFDVKWQIAMFEKVKNKNTVLLELAKLNFNAIQATLQKDLRECSMWWRNLGLIDSLDFTRDRLTESFLCTVGLVYDPHCTYFRKWLTKVVVMILIIDDVYDIYGSLQELEQFTAAVDRWDSKDIQHLPEPMKLCFQALHDIVNEIAYEIQQEKGWKIGVEIHLKKVWADFCKALLVEAKWYHEGYKPTLEEYLNNAWISSSGTLLCVHSVFFLMDDQVPDETINFLSKNQDLFHNISLIVRLCNDLGTSAAETERGDAPSSILCYMRDCKVTEDEAREQVKAMISKIWRKINGQCLSQSPSVKPFVEVIINICRMVHFLYQYEDGFGVQDRQTRKEILSLLLEPFSLH